MALENCNNYFMAFVVFLFALVLLLPWRVERDDLKGGKDSVIVCFLSL